MKNRSLLLLWTLSLPLSLSFLQSCKKDEAIVTPYGGFPVEVGKILVDNCATSGCHNNRSHDLEGRLSLEGWNDMFEGARYGNAVIPYSPDKSFLINFINRDPKFGPVTEPTMPFDLPPLSTDDVQLIYDWIADGAPDIHGHIKTPGSKKIYIANQGCDVVAVMDRNTKLVLRYIKVGQSEGFIESPHAIRVSPDGLYWYVVFLANNPYLEKYRTSDDALVGTVNLGAGDWNSFSISNDGKWGFSVAYNNRKVCAVDLQNMTSNALAPISTTEKPHGVCVNPDAEYIYVTQQDLSALYRFDFTNPFNPDNMTEIDLVQGVPSGNGIELKPHEVVFTPDGQKFIVTCSGSSEVRIYDADTESLLEVITVGDDPVEISFAPQSGLVFVTCMEDQTTWAGESGKRGSVAIIDYVNETLEKIIYTGYQPHGLVVDEEKGLVYVANRNVFPSGPAPHHSSSCGGRNGYMTAIQLSNLELLDGFKYELVTDPYAVAIK